LRDQLVRAAFQAGEHAGGCGRTVTVTSGDSSARWVRQRIEYHLLVRDLGLARPDSWLSGLATEVKRMLGLLPDSVPVSAES
jgi:hypothetical protein